MGLVSAAFSEGHQCAVVNFAERPALDVFAEFQPSIVFIKGEEWSRPIEKAVKKHNARLIVDTKTGGNWDSLGHSIDIRPAADTANFFPLKISEESLKFISEYSYINSPKNKDSEFVIRMCYPIGIHEVRVYNHPLSLVGQYAGRIAREQLPLVIANSTSIVTKESHEELIYQIGACKGHFMVEPDSIPKDLPTERTPLHNAILEKHTYTHRLMELI